MKRYYVIFCGQVQGVGFRYNARSLSYQYNCTGFVRNLTNGNVDMEIQGETANCLKVIHQLTTSDGYIRVDDYSIKEITLKDQETTFTYLFD